MVSESDTMTPSGQTPSMLLIIYIFNGLYTHGVLVSMVSGLGRGRTPLRTPSSAWKDTAPAFQLPKTQPLLHEFSFPASQMLGPVTRTTQNVTQDMMSTTKSTY